jgi:L-lysine 2,3-aminomutase
MRPEQRQEADGIDVKDRLGAAADADARVVAAQDQEIAETLVGQVPGLALQRVAVEILAGEMDHGLASGVAQRDRRGRAARASDCRRRCR